MLAVVGGLHEDLCTYLCLVSPALAHYDMVLRAGASEIGSFESPE